MVRDEIERLLMCSALSFLLTVVTLVAGYSLLIQG